MKTEYKPTRLIFGLIPWMFWTLLAAVLFALLSPFVAVALRAEEPFLARPIAAAERTNSTLGDPTPLTTMWGGGLGEGASRKRHQGPEVHDVEH